MVENPGQFIMLSNGKTALLNILTEIKKLDMCLEKKSTLNILKSMEF